MNKSKYTKQYFIERDVLIPHLFLTIKEIIKANNYKTILDVGCGSGELVKRLNKLNLKAYGCDPSIEAVKIASSKSKGKIKLSSAENLPYKNKNFDLITSISTIEHMTNKQVILFLKEAKRVLKPKGLIFLVTPNYSTPIRLIQGKNWFGYSDPTHINFFTITRLKNILKHNGYSNLNTKFNFKASYTKQLDLPFFFKNKLFKNMYFIIFFRSFFRIIRNSIWITAEKNE